MHLTKSTVPIPLSACPKAWLKLRPWIVGTTCAMLALAANLATAQSPGTQRAIQFDGTLRRVGMEKSWQAQVITDSARGQIEDLHLNLNWQNAFPVYDVVYSMENDPATDKPDKADQADKTKSPAATADPPQARRHVKTFATGSRDRFGRIMSAEDARRQADIEQRILASRDIRAEIVTRQIPALTLFAQTDSGLIQAIDAETGRTRWTIPVGNPNYPTITAAANGRSLAVANGTQLYVVDIETGKLVSETMLGGTPTQGLTITDEAILVPLTDGIVESYLIEDLGRTPLRMSCGGPVSGQPITGPDMVAWGTVSGDLFVANRVPVALRYRFETDGEIVGRAAMTNDGTLVFVTEEGRIYGLEATSGQMLWEAALGDEAASGPLVVGDRIYVATRNYRLIQIAAADGARQWSVNGATSPLASDGTRLYSKGPAGQLLVLNVTTGTCEAALPTDQFDYMVTNHLTDRIYLASRGGRVVCLRASDATWPVIHVPATQTSVTEETSADSKTNQTPSVDPQEEAPEADSIPNEENPLDAAPPIESPDDNENPFGEDSENPFG